jgi:hypothetical protein
MWYYSTNNQQQGPVTEGQLVKLLQDLTISPNTLVWKEGMPQWAALSQTELSRLLPAQVSTPTLYPPAPLASAPAYQQTYNAQLLKPAVQRIKEFKDLFTAWWILMLCGAVTAVIFIGIPAIIAAAVIAYILIYRFWEVIQDGYSRTTPGKAIGFLFIPFFSFYWIFEAYSGLSKDMNTYMNRYGIAAERLDEGLALTFCILICCSVIPYVNFLTGIAAAIIFIILMNKWKNAACAILACQAQR